MRAPGGVPPSPDLGVLEEDFVDPALMLEDKALDDRYRLKKILGIGGMGAVYEGEHTAIGNRVAVKVLFVHGRKKETLLRFRREAQAAGTIGHPNIVRVHDLGLSSEGIPYLVMDYVEGDSLAAILARDAPLDSGRAVHLVEQILLALEAAHEHGIIHRDVKPENVMVERDSEGREIAKVLDFGISKVRPTGAETQGLTQTGVVLGTPLFMAPEQARGEPDLDHRLDLYAVGTMLYIMLSGKAPFTADNYNQLLIKIVTEPPPPVTFFNAEADPHLSNVVDKAMARDREERFGSARRFIKALRGAEVLPPTPDEEWTDQDVEEATPLPRKSRRILVALLALAALPALGGLLVYGILTSETPAESLPLESSIEPVSAPVPSPSLAESVPAASVKAAAFDEPTTVEVSDPRMISVRIKTEPADARVFVAGVEVENAANHEVLRLPGEKLGVKVEAEGFRTAERAFPRDGDIETTIKLVRRRRASPPRPPPRTKKQGNFRFEVR